MFSKRSEDGSVEVDDLRQMRNMDRKAVSRKLYNRFINCFDPLYTSLIPMTGILVRFFVKDEDRTEGGIYIGGQVRQKVQVSTLQRGSGLTKEIVDEPYGFRDQCVIIATPENETTYSPGQIYACKRLQVHAPIALESQVFDYDYSFMHPSYIYMNPPTKVEDRHFGYAIVSRDRLLCRMDSLDEIIREYKDFSDEIDKVYQTDES